MNLEVNEYYLNASGEIVKIISKESSIYMDTADTDYNSVGKCIGDCREYDLIAHIPKELHWWIIFSIKCYHVSKSLRNKTIRRYNNRSNLEKQMKKDN